MASETKREAVMRLATSIQEPRKAGRWADALRAVAAARQALPGPHDFLDHIASLVVAEERAATRRSPF